MFSSKQALQGFQPSAPSEEAIGRGLSADNLQRASPSGLTRSTDQDQVSRIQGNLVELGVPRGLARELAQEDLSIGMRIYLLDNSGSMVTSDGNILTHGRDGSIYNKACTRWEEISKFATDHAEWNRMLNCPAEFMLLNSPAAQLNERSQEGRDYVRVTQEDPESVARLETLLRKNPPRGVTPLTLRLEEVRKLIQDELRSLKQKEQLVYITIATDGMPTSAFSGETTEADKTAFIDAMRRMCLEFPVQMVIRLCTDDDKVVEFYNQIDSDLELPLDIIDDYGNEAKEISNAGNNWFVYTPLIHRVREAGTLNKLLDAIDETNLKKDEVRRFVQLLLPNDTLAPYAASCDDVGFVSEMQKLLRSEKQVWDPVRCRLRPSVDAREVQKRLIGGGICACLPCCGGV